MIGFLLSKPFLVATGSVAAVGLSSAGSLLQHTTPRPAVVVREQPRIVRLPGERTVIIRRTVVRVPVTHIRFIHGHPAPIPAPTAVPPGIPVPPPGALRPVPTVTVTTPPRPAPTVTITTIPQPGCIHPPAQKCRHIPTPAPDGR